MFKSSNRNLTRLKFKGDSVQGVKNSLTWPVIHMKELTMNANGTSDTDSWCNTVSDSFNFDQSLSQPHRRKHGTGSQGKYLENGSSYVLKILILPTERNPCPALCAGPCLGAHFFKHQLSVYCMKKD